PLLIMLMLAVGYFGSAITIQHNISVAARYAARAVAMESSQSPLDRTTGDYVFREVDSELLETYARRSVPNLESSRIKAEPFPNDQYNLIRANLLTVNNARFAKINDYTFFYKNQGIVRNDFTNRKGEPIEQLNEMEMGVGALFFGVRITYRLSELDWLA